MACVAVVLVLLLGTTARSEAKRSCDVKAFGASGNGISYDTEAIQKAIDFCATQVQQDGGGMAIVVFSAPGRYLTGTLFLRSRTLLHIRPGATLLASPSQDHYPTLQSRWYLILAENVSDVGITGSDIGITRADTNAIGSHVDMINSDPDITSYADITTLDVDTHSGSDVGITKSGIIDGQSSLFVQSFNSIKNVMVSWNQTGACYGDECRPRLIGFLDCRRVRIWNLQLHQPAYWCVHIVRSEDVSIHHVSILGDFDTPNNDGIDVDSSNNTAIHSCRIDTGDDAICPKTNYGPVHNLTVSRCWIRTKSCGVKLGSATSFNFYGLNFNDIHIVDSHRGIGLQLRDPGNIFDVVFSNFNITTRYYDSSWWGRAEPIYVTSCPRTAVTAVGSITDITFVNITAVSENGIVLSGLEGGMLRNVRLENVTVYVQKVTNDTGGLLDYRPGCQGLVEHRNSGIFIENVSSLALDNVHIHLAPNVHRHIAPIEWIPATVSEGFYFVNFSLISQTSLHNMKLA
eukprot:c19130_g1_i1 orf=64-1611(-)